MPKAEFFGKGVPRDNLYRSDLSPPVRSNQHRHEPHQEQHTCDPAEPIATRDNEQDDEGGEDNKGLLRTIRRRTHTNIIGESR